MANGNAGEDTLLLLTPPYHALSPLPKAWSPRHRVPANGAAVVWLFENERRPSQLSQVRTRPPGMALIVVLPSATSLRSIQEIAEVVIACRPHSILPFHPSPSAEDLSEILRRLPSDLPMEVMDYLAWRGVQVDRDTRHLVRRIISLSAEHITVTALSRALYMSRRALGRRFRDRDIPVPSHILHFGRVLQASLLLQNSDCTLIEVARNFGYPDGFALSNQMRRLTGIRPSIVKNCHGWEWIVEAWLQKEMENGSLTLGATDPRSMDLTDASIPQRL